MLSHRSRQGWPRVALVAIAVLAILGLSAWQILARAESDEAAPVEAPRGEASRPQPGGEIPVVERVSPGQREAFSLFRTPPEGLPPRVTESLHRPSYGMSWELAQRMPVKAGVDFWAVPGRGAICIVAQEEIGAVMVNCGRTRHAAMHGVAAVLLREDPASGRLGPPRGQRLIYGLAPDGSSSVRVYTKGSVAQVPVKNGTFTLRDAVMDPPTVYRPDRG